MPPPPFFRLVKFIALGLGTYFVAVLINDLYLLGKATKDRLSGPVGNLGKDARMSLDAVQNEARNATSLLWRGVMTDGRTEDSFKLQVKTLDAKGEVDESGNSVVNPHPFDYVIFPRLNCLQGDVDFVMGVTVSRGNFESRQTIRETWGSYARDATNRALLLFIIGSESTPTPSDIQLKIDEEARLYGDILQESYIDHYQNLSLKSVSLLKWTTLHCPGSRYLLKSDDDMYVNVPLLVKTLTELSTSNKVSDTFIIGRLHRQVEPIRLKKSKYYTSLNAYNETVFPLYVSGTSYAMTTEAARVIYATTLSVPLFWLEDVYITGICGKIARVPIINTYLFPYKRPSPSGCNFLSVISGHKYTPEQMRTIHTELYDNEKKCS